MIGGTGDDGVFGQDGKDFLRGDAGDDFIDGGAGDDVVEGNGGRDVFLGGVGDDRFIFNALSESVAAARDRIDDFASGDLVDLSRMDTDLVTAGDQAFVLVSEFTRQVGQATAVFDRGTGLTVLSLDQNGDGQADFALEIRGAFTGASSYVL